MGTKDLEVFTRAKSELKSGPRMPNSRTGSLIEVLISEIQSDQYKGNLMGAIVMKSAIGGDWLAYPVFTLTFGVVVTTLMAPAAVLSRAMEPSSAQ